MTNHKINPALHLQFLFFFCLSVIFSECLSTLICLISINIIFFIYHGVPIFTFIQSFKKMMIFYFFISIVVSVSTLDMNFGIIIWIKLTLLTKNVLYYFMEYNSMELLQGLNCVLWPLDYFGIHSSKISFHIVRYFRKINIYMLQLKKYTKNINMKQLDCSWISICDKIDSIKEILKIVSNSTNKKIRNLDDMMKIKLFSQSNTRENYYTEMWKPLDFIFLIIMIIMLVKEVIR